jgi:pimeloyl-ACP methyl ester carboxylesterase
MIEAVVQAGASETPYRRAGAGGAVLLLIGATEAGCGDWLFGQVAGHFRAIAPVLPAGLDLALGPHPAGNGGGLEAWLRGLIDGLGLDRPALVSGTARGAALLRFVALDPDRVGRVVLLHPVAPGATAPADVVLDDPTAGDPHPVLVMGLPGPGDPGGRAAALERLVRFLAASP